MIGIIKKFKNIFPVTVTDAVYHPGTDKTIKEDLDKLDLIERDGDGTGYLSNDGRYKGVVDHLDSDSSDVPLSANQGKVLNETKQHVLRSAVNIRTINGESILGSGNIEIAGSGVRNNYNFKETYKSN